MTNKYKLTRFLGEGSYGKVVQGKNIITKEKVAIKFIPGFDSCEYNCAKTLREIQILKKLTNIPDNNFTVKILDIILPGT